MHTAKNIYFLLIENKNEMVEGRGAQPSPIEF